jgi:hypothetical protein
MVQSSESMEKKASREARPPIHKYIELSGHIDLDAELRAELDAIRQEEVPERLLNLALELQQKLRERSGE